MKRPPIAILWLYQGRDRETRLAQIEQWDYPEFELLDVGAKGQWSRAIKAVSKHVEVCIFWIDDGKPIGRDFLEEMVRPLIASRQLRAVMHFWSGNAISVPKDLLDASPIHDDQLGMHSLLKLLLPLLEDSTKGPGGRAHVAFSSTERLAPMSMEPLGFPS